MALNEILQTAMNNPDCSLFTGILVGQMLMVRLIIGLVIAFFIIKFFDKLAFAPFLDWVKKKIYKKKK